MVNIQRQVKLQNREAVIEAITEAGQLSYREIVQVTDISFGSVRSIIAELMEDSTVGARKGSGKTLYFFIKGATTIPKLLGSKAFIPFTQVVRASLERKLYNYDFNDAITEIFALIYSQPAIVAAGGTVGVTTPDYRLINERLTELKEAVSNLQRLSEEIEAKLLPSNLAVGWQAWADDTDYDLELAVTARAKHTEHSAALIEAYKILMAESNSGGLSHVEAIADTVDES